MKISSWINFIGILCIVFGAYRIMSCVFEIMLSQTGGTFPSFRPEFLPYVEIFINIAYILGGIFFLMRKSFSLDLMYFALTIKITFAIISVLFSKFPDYAVLNTAIELVQPLFNSIMLFVVWKLAKYYFKTPEEIRQLSGRKEKRNIFTQKRLKILSFAGILSISVPIIIFCLWIYSSTQGTTQAEGFSIFNSFFPGFLQGRYDSTYLSVVFCLIGIVIAIVCLRLRGKFWTSLNVSVLVLSLLMMMLNLWSLM